MCRTSTDATGNTGRSGVEFWARPDRLWASIFGSDGLSRPRTLFAAHLRASVVFQPSTYRAGRTPVWAPGLARRLQTKEQGCGLHRVLPSRVSPPAQSLIAEILRLNPRRRPLARKCLEHVVFARCPPLSFEGLAKRQESKCGTPSLEETMLPETNRSQALRLGCPRGHRSMAEAG